MAHDNSNHSEPFCADNGAGGALLRRVISATIPLDATATAERVGGSLIPQRDTWDKEVEGIRGRQGDQPYQSAMENIEKGKRAFALGTAAEADEQAVA